MKSNFVKKRSTSSAGKILDKFPVDKLPFSFPKRQTRFKIPDRASLRAVTSNTKTRNDDEIAVLDYILDKTSPISQLLNDEQKATLISLRGSLLKGDRTMSSIPQRLLSMPESLVRSYILKDFSKMSLERGEVKERRNPSDTFKTAVKSHGAITHMKKLKEESELRSKDMYPKEWHELNPTNRDRLTEMLSWKSLSQWNFNIIEFNDVTEGNPLLFMGWAILGSPAVQNALNPDREGKICGYEFTSRGLPLENLIEFLRTIEAKYIHDNFYHNNIHAADVLQTTHCLLQMGGHSFAQSDIELYSLLIAAIIHDVSHPGRSNAFQVKTRTELAILYNDKSVLENMHAAKAFELLLGPEKQPELDIIGFLENDDLDVARKLIIDAVLETDMSKHFDNIAKVKNLCLEEEVTDPEGEVTDPELGKQALFFILHLADISAQAKPEPLFTYWGERAYDEFFAQGDDEKQLGLPVSPLCDRDNVKVAEAQMSFIEFVVKPAYDLLGELIPRVKVEVIGILNKNLAYWSYIGE